MQDYQCTEIIFAEAPSCEGLKNFLLARAKSVLQEGPHAPTLVACYGNKIEVYTLALESTPKQRGELVDAFKDMITKTGADRVAYLVPGFIRLAHVNDTHRESVIAGKTHIADLPGTRKMLNLTIQDPLKYWQFIYPVLELEDGSAYPGNMMLAHDPDQPGVTAIDVPTLFYGRPAKAELH